MKAMFYDAMKDLPEYSVESIDGRQLSFMEVNDSLARVAKGKVLITGTWRMDKSNQYVVKNTTHTLAFSNERLPAFTIAYIGLGHWCIGGYMPQYHVIGGEMADDLIKYLKTGRANGLHLCPNEYIFDNNKLEEKFLTLDGFEHDYELLNKPESVWDTLFHQCLQLLFSCSIIIATIRYIPGKTFGIGKIYLCIDMFQTFITI